MPALAFLLLTYAAGQPDSSQPSLTCSATSPVRLSEYSACGTNCLYTACRILAIDVNLHQVARHLVPGTDGMNTFSELEAAARKLGLGTVSVGLTPAHLHKLPGPAILHVRRPFSQAEGNHYMLYLGSTAAGGVVCLDPPLVPEEIGAERFARMWTGSAMFLFGTTSEADKFRSSLSSSWLSPRDPWIWVGAGQASALVLLIISARSARHLRPSESVSEQ